MTGRSTLLLLFAARALRGFGDGFAVVVLPAYLAAIGFNAAEIGLVAAAALFGTALFTLAVGLIAPRYDLRNLLIAGAALMIATGLVFPQAEHIVFLVGVAFLGSINPSTGDIGVLIPIEHAVISYGVADADRTRAFARYSLIGTLSMAVGSLAAAAPDFLVSDGLARIAAFKAMFYAYAVLGIASAAIYLRLPHAHVEQRPPAVPLTVSRGVVYKLAALFSLDAFAGGFIVQSLLAVWLFTRFDMSVSAAGVFFFWTSVFSAFSYPAAARISRALRPRQHHGVHAHPVEHLPDPRGLRAQSAGRARPAAGALGAVADGRADALVLRDGGGDAAGAAGGGERHRGAAQPCLIAQPGARRHVADDLVPRPAADSLRHAEDRLRRGAVVLVPPHQAAGGGRVSGTNSAPSCYS